MKCRCHPGCRQSGLAVLTFCSGALAGMLLPLYIVVVIETALLLFLGYSCMFKW